MRPVTTNDSNPKHRHGRSGAYGAGSHKMPSKHMTWAELEDWRRDNNHIQSGYPTLTNSWRKSCLSLFGEPHTETVNILTHLLGALVAAGCFIYSYRHIAYPNFFGQHPLQESIRRGLYLIYPFRSDSTSVTQLDAWAFASFFVAAFLCFGFSATFHTSLGHSEAVSKVFHKLDYVGIVFLITGTQLPALYYAFYCNPVPQLIYMVGVALFGATTTFFVLSPGCSAPEYRRVRTWLFIGLGASGIVPAIQSLLRYGWAYSNSAFGLDWLLIGGLLYIVGAVLYAERIPERFSPGRFDIYGSSHQIFHIACLFAALSHYVALCLAYNFRHYDPAGTCDAESGWTVKRWPGEV